MGVRSRLACELLSADLLVELYVFYTIDMSMPSLYIESLPTL